MTDSELACVYSALILHDADIQITVSSPLSALCPLIVLMHIIKADKMTTLIKAAGVDVEPIWTTLFARALEGKTIKFVEAFYGILICIILR